MSKAPRKTSSTDKAWKRSIANAAECEITEVERVLADHQISVSAARPRARKLRVNSVMIRGEKRGTNADGPFEFKWDDLSTGLYLISSDQNSRGKSSVLNVVRAALQGRFRGNIKHDVWNWISNIDVIFAIDDMEYSVRVTKRSNPSAIVDSTAAQELDAVDQSEKDRGLGEVYRKEGADWILVFAGELGDEFEMGVSGLFIGELGIDSVFAFRKASESITQHSWPMVSSALFVTGPGPAIFGDQLADGLPLRLMQTFIGLPWIGTYSRIAAAQKLVEHKILRLSNDGLKAQLQRKARIEILEGEKAQLLEQFSQTENPGRLLQKLDMLEAKYREEHNLLAEAHKVQRQVDSDTQEIRTQAAESKRNYQQALDDNKAGQSFRALRPSMCPSCETPISQPKKTASSAPEVCGLCGHAHDMASEDSVEADLSVLHDNVQEMEEAVTAHQARLDKSKDETTALVRSMTKTLTDLAEVQAILEKSKGRFELEKSLAGVQARIDELSTGPIDEQVDAPVQDGKILSAAVEVTKERMSEDQEALLTEISEELTRYCQTFGVQNIESMRLLGNGSLDILQGSRKTSFSKMTPGECLRIRVAAALACAKASKSRGYGRHPGLLILDSPGAQEMSAKDFEQLVSSLVNTVADDDVQIIIGAVMREQLKGVVPSKNHRHADGESFLF